MSNFSMKIASTVSMVTLAATAMSASLVSAASEFLPYAELLADNAVISTQTTESGYRLGDNITRAELAKVVANLGGIDFTECTGTVYGDVNSKLGDLCGYVEALANAGVVTKANANFRPLAPVTRAEMTKMILAALGKAPSTTSAGYQDVTASLGDLAGYINTANEMGCAKSATYFRVNATSTRGETFKIAACAAELDVVTPPVNPGTSTGTTSTGTTATGVVASGALSVALDGTAVAQYVPKNASNVKVGSVKLTAGSSDVTVRSLVVARSGLGNAADILTSNGVRAAQSGVVISSSSDFYNSTSQKGNVYFYPALTIKAGTSTSVDILASLSGAENSQHQFTLETVNADNTVVSGTPVTLGLLNTTSYVTTSVTVGGTYSYTANPGKTAQTIAKVDLTAGNRDVNVNGFTLTRSGSNDLTKKFANVKVYKNGTMVGSASLTSDKLIVTGLNTPLAAGNFQAFEVRADALVDGSSSSNTLQFKIESSSDVSATEVATGYATQTTGFASYLGTVTFSNVDVTYTKQSTANQTVSPGTSNVTLFDAKVSSSVPLNVRKLDIASTLTNTGVWAFGNDQLSVKVNGSEVATITTADFTGATNAFSKVVSIPVDSTTPARITIVASSVKNTAASQAYTFSVKLSEVRDTANNTVTLITDTVTGDKTTIQAPTLTTKGATVAAPSNSTISASTNQEVGRFGLTAEGDGVRVTKVILTNTGTAVLTGVVDASSIELRDAATDVKLSGTVTLSGANTIIVDSMSSDIAKDATQNIKVVFTSVKSLDSSYGSGIQFVVAAGTGGVTAMNVNGGSAVAYAGGPITMKAYTVGVVPPTVLVTANSPLTQNAKVATIRVTNSDSNTGMTIASLTGTFQARSTANGNFTFNGTICLRDLGSTASCGATGTTTAQVVSQTGGTYLFTVSGSTLTNASTTLTKNGGYVEYEVYVDGAPLWVTGDNANVTIKDVSYTVGTTTTSQSYVGVSGASATATK